MGKVPVLVKLYFQKGSILNDNMEIFNPMKNHFINITKTLNLKPYKCSSTMNINEIISTFDNHVSNKKINTFQMRPRPILKLQRFLKVKFYI